jgi:hypothetical protein
MINKTVNISYQGPSGLASANILTSATGSLTITNLCAGTYSGFIVTFNSCSSISLSTVVTLHNPDAPTIGSDSLVQPSTCGGSDGKIVLRGLSPITGFFNVTYTKNGTPQSANIFATGGVLEIVGLEAATYNNIVISINGCISNPLIGPFILTDPALPIGNIVGPANACYGVLNGLYSITGLGAPAGYTYQWSSTGGAASNANSASTNFLFTSGGNQPIQAIVTSTTTNCSAILTSNVNVNGIPTITGVVQGACTGFAASITINATVSPNAVLEYALDGGAYRLSNIFDTVANGSHFVTARVVGSVCTSTPPFTFNVNCSCTNPAAANITGNTITCSNTPVVLSASLINASSGTWSIVSGGGSLSTTNCSINGCTTTYTPSLSGTAIIKFITNDPDGTGPCDADTALFNLIINATPTIGGAIANNPVTCQGADGSIELIGVAPAGNYTVTYSKNSVPQSITTSTIGGVITIPNLTSGTYSAIVITKAGCSSNTVSGPYTLVDPPLPVGLVNGPTPVCNGTVNGLYSVASLANCDTCGYAWSSSSGIAITPNDSTTDFNFTGTGAGSIQVVITHQTTLCTSTLTKVINVIGVPVVNSVSQSVCTAGLASVTINASVNPNALLEYSIDGGAYQTSNVFANVAAGTHTASARVFGSTCSSNSTAFTVV